MGMLTRESVTKRKLKVRRIPTPEWGEDGYVYVKSLSATEALRVQGLAERIDKGKVDNIEAMATWCVLGVCNKQGRRLFKDDDVKVLMDGPFMPLQRCAEGILDLNGLGQGAERKRRKN